MDQQLPQLVKELLQIFLHLNGIILGLSHSKDPHPAFLPCPVLLQEEGEEHEKSSIVNNPPDVDKALEIILALLIQYWRGRKIKQCQHFSRLLTDSLRDICASQTSDNSLNEKHIS